MSRLARWGQLVLCSGTVLVVRVVGAGLGFAFNVALARLLGADGLGIYHLALTFTLITSVLGRMGMGAAMLKFDATGYVAKDLQTQVVATFLPGAALQTTKARPTSEHSANARDKRCRPRIQRKIEQSPNLRVGLSPFRRSIEAFVARRATLDSTRD